MPILLWTKVQSTKYLHGRVNFHSKTGCPKDSEGRFDIADGLYSKAAIVGMLTILRLASSRAEFDGRSTTVYDHALGQAITTKTHASTLNERRKSKSSLGQPKLQHQHTHYNVYIGNQLILGLVFKSDSLWYFRRIYAWITFVTSRHPAIRYRLTRCLLCSVSTWD